jgi:hypothetical protein
VDILNAATGSNGAMSTPVQRAWRDVNAVARHVSLNWDSVGAMYSQMALGLEPRGQCERASSRPVGSADHQTAPSDTPRLAIMMHEHTALCLQLAFVQTAFRAARSNGVDDLRHSNHDAGWFDFDRNPAIDEKTGLPYNCRNGREYLRRPVGSRLISTNAIIRIAV